MTPLIKPTIKKKPTWTGRWQWEVQWAHPYRIQTQYVDTWDEAVAVALGAPPWWVRVGRSR